jgi:peptidoglycan/xylan/chitin deacetylase (PgdA/CDA1 family)
MPRPSQDFLDCGRVMEREQRTPFAHFFGSTNIFSLLTNGGGKDQAGLSRHFITAFCCYITVRINKDHRSKISRTIRCKIVTLYEYGIGRIMKRYGKKAICILTAVLIAWGALCLPISADAGEEPADGPVYLPIIMYHQVKTYSAGKDVILPWEFESDLKFLADENYTTITIRDLIEYVYADAALPEKPIILSFDDGYLNNYVYVLPLLKKYDRKIVFSIIGKNTDDFTDIPDDNLDYSHVTWDQLNEMLDSGCVEVQNHTYDLHRYCKSRIGCRQMPRESDDDYEKTLREDVLMLQEKITLMTGYTPTAFAYPYGAYSDNTDKILKQLGFQATLSCSYGINTVTRDPGCLFQLKRICRSHNQSIGKVIHYAFKTIPGAVK